MEIVKIDSVDNHKLDINVAKRFRRIICSRSCNAMRMKTANFSQIDAGEVLYDAILNDVGSLFFRKSIYGEYYGSSSSDFFSEYSNDILIKLNKTKELRTEMSDILGEINNIEKSIKGIK